MRHRFAAALAAIAAGGCASIPFDPQGIVQRGSLPTAVRSSHEEQLDKAVVESALEESADAPYRVGPGDALIVSIYRHPELTPGSIVGGGGGARTYLSPSGSTHSGLTQGGGGLGIENDGTIQFPLLGVIHVAGKTTAEIKQQLEGGLAKYMKDPEVTVQVASVSSQRYFLLGEFASAGIKVADRPMSLLELIALGGSVNLARANLRAAYVARNGRKLPVNLERLLRHGDIGQNIRMVPGDIVFVPDNSSLVVYVVTARGGTAVPFPTGNLNLLQALALGGLSYESAILGRLDEVRIIRAEGDRAEFYVVDAEKILRGEASPFPLMAGDIIYIPESALASWNAALAQLLPSLSAISGLLQPFVQIRFLSQ